MNAIFDDMGYHLCILSTTPPVYVRTMVSTDSTVGVDTLVYDGIPHDWASLAWCGLSVYYTDTHIWIIRDTTDMCMGKFLCQGM